MQRAMPLKTTCLKNNSRSFKIAVLALISISKCMFPLFSCFLEIYCGSPWIQKLINQKPIVLVLSHVPWSKNPTNIILVCWERREMMDQDTAPEINNCNASNHTPRRGGLAMNLRLRPLSTLIENSAPGDMKNHPLWGTKKELSNE